MDGVHRLPRFRIVAAGAVSMRLPLRSSTRDLIPIVSLLSPPSVAAVGEGREPDLSPIAGFAVAVAESSPASALLLDLSGCLAYASVVLGR